MKKSICILMLICALPVWAVYVNPKGMGEVLLVPYYSVNNDLNTLVTVTNTTAASKAIKINIREGLNGYAVLSYNVYLDAYDSWAFGFASTTSTVSGYAGQSSARQYSADNSCAPFLNKNGQEFLPFELTDGPNSLERSREGFIEIIEMGELQGAFVDHVDQGNEGVPADCQAFESAWMTEGQWHADSGGSANQDLAPVAGGLMAEAYIINVTEGINYSIPVVALDGFFASDSAVHVNPGDTGLSLDAAAPLATVMANQQTYQLGFETGADAVSAVLMVDELFGHYAIDSFIDGKSEMVFSLPTRRFYIAEQGDNNQAPFNAMNHPRLLCPTEPDSNALSQYGGTSVDWLLSDRESQLVLLNLVFDPPPPRFVPAVCDSVAVWQFLPPGHLGGSSGITGSSDPLEVTTPATAVTENGFINIQFEDTRPLLGTNLANNSEVELQGLPIIAISLQQFTNVAAGPGLLAQYGASQLVKSKVKLSEQPLPQQ